MEKKKGIINYFSGNKASLVSKSFLLIFTTLVLLLSVSYVLSSADLETPIDNAWVAYNNDTVAFMFNVSELSGTIECNLTLNGAVVAENTSVAADTSTTLYSNTSFLPGANTWSVACANTTDVNTSAARTLNYDAVAPVPIIETANHSWFSDTTPPISFNVTDLLDNPIAYQFYVDGSFDAVASGTVPNATSSSADLNTLTQGSHTVLVEATDEAGNKANSSSITIYVDTTAPTVTLISPVNNANTSTPNPSLIFNVSDNLGSPYNCSLYLDGVYNQSNASTLNATTTTFTIPALSQASHTWNVSCRDNATNQGSALRTLTVDQTSPVPVISETNQSWFNTTTPSIDFVLTDNLLSPISYQFYVDSILDVGGAGTAVNNTPSNDALSAMSQGMHTLILEATDSAGNKANSSSLTMYVDTAAPTVIPITADNYNFSTIPATLQFNVSDDSLGGPYNCSLYINNTYNQSNWFANATTVDFTFGAASGMYAWKVNCSDNATNYGASTARTVGLDAVAPTITSALNITELDNFVSGVSPNNNITLRVTASDIGTGVYYVTANLTGLSGAVFGGGNYQNLTYNAGIWSLVVTLTDTTTLEFTARNITVTAYDYVGNASAESSPATVVLYNMTTMRPSPDGCSIMASGSTDFSTETDWNHINITLLVDRNFSAACMPGIPAFAITNNFTRVAKFNFSDMNMTPQASFNQLGQFMSSIDITITPDGQFGASRISLNSSAVAAFNRTAVLTLYGLPFDSMPNILADAGAAGVNNTAFTTLYEPYTTAAGTFGNLTFMVNGFTGYNASDTTNPLITVNAPTPNATLIAGNTTLINVTVNGTGTQVSNITVVLDGTPYYMASMNCYNATGSEQMNCYFTTPELADSTHQFIVYAWDYGVAAPGNANSTAWNFTTDSSLPSVTLNSPASGANLTSGAVTFSCSATDSALSNVTLYHNASGWHANQTNTSGTSGPYSFSKTIASDGVYAWNCRACDTSGNCMFATQNRTFTIDTINPAVTGMSLSASQIKSTSNLQVNATVTDTNGPATVYVNSTQMTVLTGSVYSTTQTPAALGCAANAVCTLVINATDYFGHVNSTVGTTVTVDDTAPTVTFIYNSTNLTSSSTAVILNVTVTDTIGNVSSVYANNKSMTQIGATTTWYINAAPNTFNCGTTGTCTVTFTANDTAGNSDTSTSTTLSIDNDGPSVTGANVTNTTSGKAKIGTVVNIQVTVSDSPAGVASVAVNGTTMYLMGATWQANTTGTLLGCAANSLCTLLFTATDNLGNINNTETTTYTTDDAGPVNTTAFSATPSSTSATVAATMDEAAQCTVAYGTNASALSTSVNSSGYSASVSASLSGLSASTVYYYNVTSCWDELGNPTAYTTYNGTFTTSAAGGGGGGGSGGSSGMTATSTIELGDLTGGQTEMELKRGDSMHFNHNAEEHYIKVTALGEASAEFEVLSEPQKFNLYIGQSKDIILDQDAKPDINVKLLDIIANKALVKVTSLVSGAERISLLPPAKKTVQAPSEGESLAGAEAAAAPAAPEASAAPAAAPSAAPEAVVTETKPLSGLLIPLAIVVIIIVAVVWVVVAKKKKA